MPSSNKGWMRAAAVALLPACLAAAAIAGPPTGGKSRPPLPPISPRDWQPQAGDVVFRASQDLVGERIRSASGGDAVYSHVGVVVRRDGVPVIVDVSPFGSGHVDFTAVARFTTDPDTTDLLVMRPRRPLDAARLTAEAGRLAEARIGFDYDFDMADGSELYCAELVFHLLRTAGLDLASVRWTQVYVPFAGDRKLVTPDALAHAATLGPIFRRRVPG